MPPTGFEPAVAASKRALSTAFDRVATGIRFVPILEENSFLLREIQFNSCFIHTGHLQRVSIGCIQWSFPMVINAAPCTLEARNVKIIHTSKAPNTIPHQKLFVLGYPEATNSMKTINRKDRIVEVDGKAFQLYPNNIKSLSSKRQYVPHTIPTPFL